MCTQRPEMNWSSELYQKHGEAMTKYFEQSVSPVLRGKTGTELLREMRVQWENHKIYNNWMEKIFTYLVSLSSRLSMLLLIRFVETSV